MTILKQLNNNFLFHLLLIVGFNVLILFFPTSKASFTEDLLLHPLPSNNHILAHFRFIATEKTEESNNNFNFNSNRSHHLNTTKPSSVSSSLHPTTYTTVPKSLAHPIRQSNASFLRVSFTQGRWDYDSWGCPSGGVIHPPPVGAQVLAAFPSLSKQKNNPNKNNRNNEFNFNNNNNNNNNNNQEKNEEENQIDTAFNSLVHSLSGLLCASLNFLDRSGPSYASGVVADRGRVWEGTPANSGDVVLRHGTLSRETVCTENLTPFKALLPGRGKSGLGALLSPRDLYAVPFHALSIDVEHRPEDNTMRVIQSVSVVLPINDSNNNNNSGKKKWSLFSLFRHSPVSLIYASPLATSSRIIIPTHHRNDITLSSPLPNNHNNNNNNNNDDKNQEFYVYNLHDTPLSPNLSIQISNSNNNNNNKNNHTQENRPYCAISARRYQTGYGSMSGAFVLRIGNNLDRSLAVTYFDAVPWYVRLYLHTAQFHDHRGHRVWPHRDFQFYQVSAGQDGERGTTIEFGVELAPRGFIEMQVEFDKGFLPITQHPPDANRGFDLSSSVVSFDVVRRQNETSRSVSNDGDGDTTLDQKVILPEHIIHTTFPSSRVFYYTQSLIVSLPTPDFSMPYNVITLTCTVISMFIGSLNNVLQRRWSTTTLANVSQ